LYRTIWHRFSCGKEEAPTSSTLCRCFLARSFPLLVIEYSSTVCGELHSAATCAYRPLLWTLWIKEDLGVLLVLIWLSYFLIANLLELCPLDDVLDAEASSLSLLYTFCAFWLLNADSIWAIN